MKYVFITGGVVSSLGKGITAASLGKLLRARGYRVSLQKLDLYYNVEPGFLSPLEHGEAFITEDGTAADLDLGHYERFVDTTLSGDASSTTGKIHHRLIERELSGEYRGSTIQAIPHVANEIKRCIREAAENAGAEIQLVEIGGTVGDMEAAVYLEAIRQMRWECPNPNDCCYVHVTLMPFIVAAGELKTKPTQNSVKVLRSTGIQPDVIVCRTEVPMTTEAKDKVALFCNVKAGNVIQNLDVDCLYEVPLMLEKEGLAKDVLAELGLENRPADLDAWKAMYRHYREVTHTLHIALVGKYVTVPDAYLSVSEALQHAGLAEDVHVAVTAEAVDTTVSLEGGRLLHGSGAPESFTEVWTLLRRPGAKTLSRPGLMEGYCPNCGNKLALSTSITCASCQALINSGEYDWVLAEITQGSQFQPHPMV
ncbi:MAG TPA: CTP synthase, partial [Candidatus Limiplasma sp.]|nr:CTP synthase [Candidatus Limiplasma sp.]